MLRFAVIVFLLVILSGCATGSPPVGLCGNAGYVPICDKGIKVVRCTCVRRDELFGGLSGEF